MLSLKSKKIKKLKIKKGRKEMSSIYEKIKKSQESNYKLEVPIISPTKSPSSKFNFRVLPYKHQKDYDPFIEIYMHSDIGAKKNRFAVCPKNAYGEECVYCSAGEKVREEVSKEEWNEMYKTFKPIKSMFVPGMVRGKKGLSFAFLKIAPRDNFDRQIVKILTNEELKKLFKLPPETQYIDIWDLKSGLDLIVEVLPAKDGQKYPTFSITSALQQTPAGVKKDEIETIKEAMEEMPNLIEEYVKAYGCKEKLEQIYKEQFVKASKKSDPVPPSVDSGDDEDSVELPSLDTRDDTEDESDNASVDDEFDSIMRELDGSGTKQNHEDDDLPY